MTPRRTVLQILGVGALAAVAGGGYWGSTRRPTAALAPWTAAGAYDEPRMRALSYAILAPNSHNLQSWLVELDGDDALTLYANPDKLLPMTDPFSRQITISLGCFLELLRIAAAEDGFEATIHPFPEGFDANALDARPVARVTFRDGGAPDPLFAQILRRRTFKDPYDLARAIAPEALAAIAEAVETPLVATASTLEPSKVDALKDLAWEAHQIEVKTPRTLKESVDVMRIGRSEIEASPDGIDLGGAFLEGLNLIGALDRPQLADPTSSAFQQGLDMYREIIFSAGGFLWQTSAANDRLTQLQSGRAWVRAQLKATELGLQIHPLSQALQEYPEMAELYDAMPEMLDAPGQVVQMLARVGYAPADMDPSPRWPLEAKLV